MNHAPHCDCFECLPGLPVTTKPRVKRTRPERRVPFKRRVLRGTVERLRAGLATVVNG